MIISEQIDQLRKSLSDLRKENNSALIGFVPTMGALHDGHLELIKKASQHSDIVVVSIFVNPTQFNDSTDLANYPRTLTADIEKLQQTATDVLFIPLEKEIYPNEKKEYSIDLMGLDEFMEGKFRKGHFKGVSMVVERFFEIVKPDKAFFGLKDFQQIAIIRQMVKARNLAVEIIPVEIVRSDRGLALSSRNELLSADQKTQALHIYKTLQLGKSLVGDGLSPEAVKSEMLDFFAEGSLELEYITLVEQESLQEAKSFQSTVFCCIAAYCGKVRLIDNMQFS